MLKLDIDMLIRGILDDLTVVPVKDVAPIPEEKTNEIFIDSRVVSLADIKMHGETKRICIAPKSILTPSAKDEIRKRKIEVAVKLPISAVERSSAVWLAVQRPAVFPSAVLSRFDTEPGVFETAAALVESAVKHLSNNNLGVALSRQAATLLCVANRHAKIRAIPAFEPKQAVADAVEVDANLLVLHPDRAGRRMTEIIDFFIQRKTF